MKITLAFVLLIASLSSFAQSQITLVSKDTRVAIRNTDPDFADHPLLYVLKSEDQYQEVLVSTNEDIFKYIEASDIQAIDVFKGESAINKFGSKAEYGAVVLHFKKDKFKRLQKDLEDKLIEGK